MNHTALITGASAGIGLTFARHLAAEGHSLLLVARRADKLNALAAELRAKHGIRAEFFPADLKNPAVPAEIIAFARERDLAIDILINNAGLSQKEAFAQLPWETHAADIQIMITAVTELAHRVIPGMRARGWGRIVNLSSLAAFLPPGASLLYTAMKSYVLNMSQALDMELKPLGINVTALCPGFTHSEFHDAMGTRDTASKLPDVLWQQPEDVVREGWDAVMNGKPICVTGMVNRVIAAGVRPVPAELQYYLGRAFNPFASH